MKIFFLVASGFLLVLLVHPRVSAQSALPGPGGADSPLSFLNDWNEAINRFFTESLKQLSLHYVNRAKDLLVSVFWVVVDFVKNIVGYLKNVGGVVW